eukprot:6175255-Pleurochrysis_carterae.AAC.4
MGRTAKAKKHRASAMMSVLRRRTQVNTNLLGLDANMSQSIHVSAQVSDSPFRSQYRAKSVS